MGNDAPTGRAAPARKPGTPSGKVVRLRPANPFDLIRLIAHSQSDPRKAIAELVQNSLDAGARNVTISRYRKKKVLCLSIFDDGRGVFPDLGRPEALEQIATNVGHSFKRNLSAAERQKEMMLGKYGIGILGFWAVGEDLEMRSRVAGSEVWSLRLRRDEASAEVLRLPERLIPREEDTWTEILIRGVHDAAARQIAGRRLGDYLGAELRGQLLERPVKLRIADGIARGRAPKDFLVVPQRFRGRRVQEVFQLHVVGHSPARLEIYYVDPEEERQSRPTVALTCGGTTVLEDISAAESHEVAHPPWSSGCFEGVIEFPDLEVAPATRRSFIPGPASEALFEALKTIEKDLLQVMDRERDLRRAEEDENLAQELRKVFRPVAKRLPQYDFFDVSISRRGHEAPPEEPSSKLGTSAGAATPGPDSGALGEIIDEGDQVEPEPEILPPGPLASVRIVPRKSRLLPGAARVLTAKAADDAGRRILEAVSFTWTLRSGPGTLTQERDQATYTAPGEIGTARIFVQAREWNRTSEADAIIEVVDRLEGEKQDGGIPDPERVVDPTGDWRSRVVGRRWQYNAGHPDYEAVVDDPRRRFRYLIHLFAKEIVLRNYGEPQDERVLERMVEVLTHISGR